MRTSLTLLLSFALLPMAQAQQVQKCCGTSSSTFLLGSTSYARHTQCLYLPGELTGAMDGQITRLYYRYGNSGIALGNTLGNLSISMLQTTATSFTGVNFLTGLDTVYHPATLTIAPGASGDWFFIGLDTPFDFDASLSLVVDINFETSSNTAFGTMSQGSTSGRKIMSSSSSATSGESWTTLQDIGFDLATTGLADRSIQGLRIFPNPAASRVELVWMKPLGTKASLSVADPLGRTVRAEDIPAGSTRSSVDIGSLPVGIYLLVLRDETGLLHTGRLVRE